MTGAYEGKPMESNRKSNISEKHHHTPKIECVMVTGRCQQEMKRQIEIGIRFTMD